MTDQYNPIELITIQANYPYSNPNYPGLCDNWKTFCRVYAELQIGAGREFFGAKQINAELDGIIKTLQFVRGITNSMRINCSYGILPIISVIPLKHKNSVEIHIGKQRFIGG